MEDVGYVNQNAYCAKPDGSATVQVGEGKIEAIDGELYLSGDLDLGKFITEKRP